MDYRADGDVCASQSEGSMNDIYEGMRFYTWVFGQVHIKRLTVDGDKLKAECRSDAGEALFLSLAYIRKLMGVR
jgi:hypothetical protein